MDITDRTGSTSSSARPRIQYACEACRIAKVKCTPSDTGTICRRCSRSKRECVFHSGPRTRRRRSILHPAATRKTPPPSAPSKTFTINVPMSAEDGSDMEPSDSVDALRDAHEGFIDDLVPEPEPGSDSSTVRSSKPQSSVSGRAFSPSTPSVSSRSVHSLSSVQPQFNLDSAASLLESFRDGMLPRFPVIVLAPDETVPSLARDRPFVLLAILAAASGVRSLQGHSLYDEEFRKVLGFKFVSGGERSLELLVGLLIYCAWYPFHLRPKNKQAFQYVRMAEDIVHDLELDQAVQTEDFDVVRANQKHMTGIRAYLACYCLCSSFASAWAKSHTLPYQQWTATCCDILERNVHSQASIADQSLAWLARLGHIREEISLLSRAQGKPQHGDQHTLLMVKGMEAQLQEWQVRMSPEVLRKPALKMANMYTDIILCGYPILKLPSHKSQNRGRPSTETHVDPSRLFVCVENLRKWYDYIISLPASEFVNFAHTDWARFIGAVILGLRMSFPIPSECPGWDHAAARQVLDLGTFLDRFREDDGDTEMLTPASSKKITNTDVLSASKVVLGVVKRKYEKRLAALRKAAAMEPPHSVPPDTEKGLRKCPLFDGSIDPYVQSWDDSFLNSETFASPPLTTSALNTGSFTVNQLGSAPDAQPVIFHDLWATMTMGWSQEGFGNVDFRDI